MQGAIVRTATQRERVSNMATVYEIVTDQIVKALEAGVVPWRRPWQTVAGRFPRNAQNRPYRGINVWLLAASRAVNNYKSNFWVTYKQAQKMGGTVKKGEKSTIVTFWKVGEPERDPETGKMRRPFMLRYYRVFNLDQCENLKLTKAMKAEFDSIDALPELPSIDEAEAIVATYFARDGAPVLQPDGGNAAYYIPSLDTLQVPERGQFSNPADFYATMFHEMTHSTGHESRCNRKLVGSHNRDSYGREELVAEMGAAFLQAESGIGAETFDNNAAYIGSWLRTIKGDSRLVVQAASAAQKAVDFILGTEYNQDSTDESEAE
jgi:antirestriction protein ArdC